MGDRWIEKHYFAELSNIYTLSLKIKAFIMLKNILINFQRNKYNLKNIQLNHF